ncbi:hypothetical protein D3C78_1208770 [compost metagenome]
MKTPAVAQQVVGMLVQQTQTSAALQLVDDLRNKQGSIARVRLVGADPVLAANQVTGGREQQPRAVTVADRPTHVRRKHRMQVREHHGVYLPFCHPQPRQAVEQARRWTLTAAGWRQRCQQRLGPRHDQDVHPVLLHQQDARSHLDLIVTVRAQPLAPGAPRRGAEQRATIELARPAGH